MVWSLTILELVVRDITHQLRGFLQSKDGSGVLALL
ncbi:hypothetical protein FOWG_16588 [Fusarium oxysporum f. sp. lycopersici MN25]|nr:hypothetical protein FOWG_16588 [Fusarium oxysporum f. sp. lycopersici MN25]